MKTSLRLLHTADWHLGKTLKGVDRTPEVASALEEVLRLVRSEKVDLVLVSGDLMDHPQPSTEAEALLVEFFLRLAEAKVSAMAIAGNHDSGERMERVYRQLLGRFGVELRGQLAFAHEGGVVDRGGLRVALVPFLSERRLAKTLELPPEERHLAYAEGMRRLLAHLAQEGTPDVYLAHFTVAGARVGGGEYVLHLAEHYAVPPGALPGARYIALGHLHALQQVAENAWYPGSLIPLDFGASERAERGVVLVEFPLNRHLPARVHPMPTNWGKPLRTFRVRVSQVQESPGERARILGEIEAFPGWARVVVQGPMHLELRDTLKEMERVLEVAWEEEREGDGGEAHPPPSALEEAYRQYLMEAGRWEGDPPGEELVHSFAELRQEVEEHEAGED